MKKYKFLAILPFLALLSCLSDDENGKFDEKIFFEEDKESIIKNPCMGWGVYDDANDLVANADEYWEAQGEAASKYASFFYIRWRWSEIEPEEGKYAWVYDENYKKLVKGALDRGLHLCFRIYNHAQDNWGQSTPDYVREAGAKGRYLDEVTWTPYADDPVFLAKLEKFVKAFAEEYDNPDIVDFVDAFNVGWWGECNNIELQHPGQKNLENLLDKISTIYSSNFKHVMLALPFCSQVGFEAEKRIAIEGKGYSMRRDGLGSMWFDESQRAIAQKMYGKTLLIGESCYWQCCTDDCRPWEGDPRYYPKTWRDVYAFTYQDAIKGHFNTLDLRESTETYGWTTRAKDLVESFCRKGGYRIHPVSVSYSNELSPNEVLKIRHTWVNTATGYLPNNVCKWNFKYRTTFAIMDKEGNVVHSFVDESAEPSEWLTNQEHTYTCQTKIPDLKSGNYSLAVAITDETKDYAPAIRLALKNVNVINGWYQIGNLLIK